MSLPGPLGPAGVVVAALMALANAYPLVPEYALVFAPGIVPALALVSYAWVFVLRTVLRAVLTVVGGASAG